MRRLSLILMACLTAAALVLSFARTDASVGTNYADERTGAGGTAPLNAPIVQGSYADYSTRHRSIATAERPVVIEGEAYSRSEGMSVTVLDRYEGSDGQAILTGETGSVTWDFEVPQEGLYQIAMRFYTVQGKDSDIERELAIDGAVPFAEAKSLVFHRVWKNASPNWLRDDSGNDLPPEQVEAPMWQDVLLKDNSGLNADPYVFYFSSGRHTLTLTSVKEPLAIDSITLAPPKVTPTYEQVASAYREKGYKPAENVLLKIQGEDAAYKSSPSLQPYNDRSSPALEPFDAVKIRNNAMGAYRWRTPGQWIEWEVEVPVDGLYELGFKNRQNYLRGFSTVRSLTIDGELPFREAAELGFPYGSPWQMTVLGESKDRPYLFYLTQGKHRIRLEVALGDLAAVVRTVQSSILELNAMYREIISYTGVVPDTFRDYQLEQRIPDMTRVFSEQSALLYRVASYIEGPSGKNSERTSILNSLAYQLEDMAKRPDTVASRVDSFKGNVGALGAWLLTMNEQPLAIDYLTVSSPDAKLPKPGATWWQKTRAGAKAFFASFYEDYDQYGKSSGDDRSITVWVTAGQTFGRDQAQIIRRLIDGSFTTKTGIPVNLRLVGGDVLLTAVVAGTGPDVALPVTSDMPVNFASRGALQDLSKLPGFDDIARQFEAESFVPYQYNGGTYALPNEQTFPVLFYRKDILEDELNLQVPQTWEELYALLPTLQKHNLQFGFAELVIPPGVQTLPISPAFGMLLYQEDGQFYTDDHQASALDSETAIEAFKRWTEFYAAYKLPIKVDFANRFRTGEMPIAIADYTEYNKLTVFAPEIKGLWDFAPVPGTVGADGTIRREVAGGGSAAVLFEAAKNKDEAWQFLKWWASAETQLSFGRQVENRLGPSGRYATANLLALEQLPWPRETFRTLSEQLDWLRGIPEVPGGYLTSRHVDNAFRRVVIQGEDPRESMDYYVRYIDDEIEMKRKEFHLPYQK